MITNFLRICILFWVCISAAESKVRINEVMSSNKNTFSDEDGSFSDWIELYNSGEDNVDLTGMYLSDDKKKLNKWTFPHTVIPAKEYLLIWASGKDKTGINGELHTNFSISADGEELILTDAGGLVIDRIEIPAMSSDKVYCRIPDGSDYLLISETPTPGNENIYSEFLTAPVFSNEGGFYQTAFNLTLTHPDPEAIILYTLDGSEPLLEHLDGYSYQYKNRYKELPINPNGSFINDQLKSFIYSGSISIRNRTSEPLDAARIPSTFQFNADYIPSATQDVFKGTVVRARVFKEGVGYGPISVHTFFVTSEGRSKYSLPVIALTASKDHLFDYEKGIHVAGADFDEWRSSHPLIPANPSVPANYQRRGDKWEYPGHFEYFEASKNIAVLNQQVGYRIHGGWTRSEPQKAFRIYARKDYGASNLEYPFFTQTQEDKFKRIILKNTFNFRVTDALTQDMVRHLNFPTQASQYAILFLNGEYWGIQEIKERFDKYFLESKYGIDPDNIDYLNNEAVVDEGDNLAYLKLLDYVRNSSMTSISDYNYLENNIDLENYIDYYATEIYTSNRDWPHNNIDYWRVKTDSTLKDVPYGHDGRWRWMVYDLDLGMNGVATADSFTHNTLEWASRDHSSTVLFRNSIKNPTFSAQFINRFADLLNTTFLYERIYPLIEQQKKDIVKFFPEHLKRWANINGGISRLNQTFDRMSNFVQNRSSFVRQDIQDKFQLKGQIQITLDVNYRNSRNYVRINTIDINNKTIGVATRPYPWKGIYFDGVPVKITAIATEGYEFSHWEGMPAGTPASFTGNFEENTTLTAHFNKLFTPEYFLNYTSSIGGYLEGDSTQKVEENAAGKAVTAVALQGYSFQAWSDGRTDNPRIDSDVLEDVSVQAMFRTTTRLKETQAELLKVYPNPAKHVLTIEKPELKDARYMILNVFGQQIQSGTFLASHPYIDISQLPEAVYILWIEDETGQRAYHKFGKN